jgi:hypothetical protein
LTLRRSPPRFSLRDLLWLTAVAASGLGWWADHRAARLRQRADENRLIAREGILQTAERFLQETEDFDRQRLGAAIKDARGEWEQAERK